LAQLARKERAIRQQSKQLEQQRRDLESMRSQAKPESPTDWKAKLFEDPTSVGLSYDELTQLVVNRGNPQDTALRKMQVELERLKAEQQENAKRIEDSQSSAYQTALKQVKRDVERLVSSNEEFETIRESQAHDAVVDLIEATYKEDGILLTAEEAAKEVEAYLVEQALKLASLKKIKAKLAPAEAATPQQKPAPQTQQRQPTLTNRIEQASRPMTAAERRARAIAAFKGESA
jgi:vacuolar-type H+-ATPase subunit I/STV1